MSQSSRSISSGGQIEAGVEIRDAAPLVAEITGSGKQIVVIALPELSESFGADVRGITVIEEDEAPLHGLDGVIVLGDCDDLVDLGSSAGPTAAVEEGLRRIWAEFHRRNEPAKTAEAVGDGWGPEVSDEEAVQLEQANIQLQVEQRREQMKVSFTRAQAADILGISAQTVSEWVAQHRLVGLKDGREWRFPAWQFTPDNAEPVLPELHRLVDAFPGGVVSLSRWMNRPNDNFDGRTPAQEMVRDSDHVFAVVETLAAA